MLVRTLTRAAGRLSFEPGELVELDPADAEELSTAGAVQIVVTETPEVLADGPKEDSGADQPSGRTKRRS